MGTVLSIIGRLLAVFVLFESFEFSLYIVLPNFVFGIECEPPLPLNHIYDREEDSKDDYTSQVHRESVEYTENSIVNIVLISSLTQSQHKDEIGAIATKPEKEEVCAISFV